MKKKKDEITIRSSAAEYLTYVASVGDSRTALRCCYEDGEYMADTKDDGHVVWRRCSYNQ